MPRYFDKNMFLEKAEKIHRKKYDYRLVVYKKSAEKVKIICPKHGLFLQTPNSHLGGKGCVECGKITSGKKQRIKPLDFVQRARDIHGYWYFYEDLSFNSQYDKIEIRCPDHGKFYQSVNAHLVGKGCVKCARESTRLSTKYDLIDFIQKSQIAHGEKYNYSESIYTHSEDKIQIICPKHGSFWQIAKTHMNGGGCMECCIDGRRGKNSATYKHGKSKKYKDERFTRETYHWTKKIKEAEYCDCCGVVFDKNFTKHAHHLDGWVNFPKKRHDINNGVCICHNCHYDFHSEYGSGYNTREQYILFKETMKW